jgi:hypothetical protein
VRLLAADNTTRAAFELLEGAGIEALLLKGAGIAAWLYSDEVRASADVDILVREADFEVAVSVLGAAGYRYLLQSPTERAQSDHAQLLVIDQNVETGAAGPEGPLVPIDLHWSFHGVGAEPGRFWACMTAGAERIDLAGRPVPVPPRVARALLLALHAQNDAGEPSKALEDLRRGLEQGDQSTWDQASSLAVELAAVAGFARGLCVTPAGRAEATRLGLRWSNLSSDRNGPALISGSPLVLEQRTALCGRTHPLLEDEVVGVKLAGAAG